MHTVLWWAFTTLLGCIKKSVVDPISTTNCLTCWIWTLKHRRFPILEDWQKIPCVLKRPKRVTVWGTARHSQKKEWLQQGLQNKNQPKKPHKQVRSNPNKKASMMGFVQWIFQIKSNHLIYMNITHLCYCLPYTKSQLIPLHKSP